MAEISEGPVGVEGPLPVAIAQGIEEFNQGAYYECHDTIEAHWVREVGPQRLLYQGILQIAVACYHAENGNWPGAMKMLERGVPKLRPFAPVCQGIDVAALLAAAKGLAAELARLGEEGIEGLSRALFPKIQVMGVSP